MTVGGVLCRQNVAVVRTVTHSAFGGLISSRDFVDLVVNETTPDFILTSGQRLQLLRVFSR